MLATWKRFFFRLLNVVRHDAADRELSREVTAHLTLLEDEFIRRGLTPDDARLAARRTFGRVDQVKERHRDERSLRWLDDGKEDLRYAVRTLCRTPGFAAVAILTLGLGIGANTAIFSVVNSLLLRALPVKDPAGLVLLKGREPVGFPEWSYPVWEQIRQRQALFEGALSWSWTRFDLASGGQTQLADGLWGSGSFFETLGVVAFRGRTFSDADDRRDAHPVAVISYAFWQRHFAGATDAIGRALVVDRVSVTIIGVTPPSFLGPDVGRTFDVIVPFATEPLLRRRETSLDRRDRPWLTIMARLKSGQTLGAVTAEVRREQASVWSATVPENWPADARDAYVRQTFTLVPAATGDSSVRTQYQRPILTIMVVVILLLLTACASIANLLLARALGRRRELSVRRALGASRWRLVRQLLTESVVLAAVGSVVGMVIASWGSRLLVRQISTATSAVSLDLSIDWQVLLFATGITTATALLVGVAPALQASRVAPMDALKDHAPNASGSTRPFARGTSVAFGPASGLVGAQIALSVMLVVAAALLVRTYASLSTRPLGFEPARVLVVSIDAQQPVLDGRQRILMYEKARMAVRALPGVEEASVSILTPLATGPIFGLTIQEVSGGVQLRARERFGAVNFVSPGWFRTFGTSILEGRDFADGDGKASPVALVNQAFARRFLAGASPVGHSMTFNLGPARLAFVEIVGAVSDGVYGSLRYPVQPTVYLPLALLADLPAPMLASTNLSLRSSTDHPAVLTRSVAAAIGAVNPDLALTIRPLASQVDDALTQERVIAGLSGCFGGLSLVLAWLGLYGVTSHAVSRRCREIGIRMALGAQRSAIVGLVLRESVTTTVVGIAAGVSGALWAARYLQSLLFGVTPSDPTTFIAVSLLFAGVATIATLVPARRATRVDPVVALRSE